MSGSSWGLAGADASWIIYLFILFIIIKVLTFVVKVCDDHKSWSAQYMQEKMEKSLTGLPVLDFMAIPAADTVAAFLRIENVSRIWDRSKAGKYQSLGLSVCPEEPGREWDAFREVLEAKSTSGINQCIFLSNSLTTFPSLNCCGKHKAAVDALHIFLCLKIMRICYHILH